MSTREAETIKAAVRFVLTHSELYSTQHTDGAVKLTEDGSWLSFPPKEPSPETMLAKSRAHTEARITAWQNAAVAKLTKPPEKMRSTSLEEYEHKLYGHEKANV